MGRKERQWLTLHLHHVFMIVITRPSLDIAKQRDVLIRSGIIERSRMDQQKLAVIANIMMAFFTRQILQKLSAQLQMSIIIIMIFVRLILCLLLGVRIARTREVFGVLGGRVKTYQPIGTVLQEKENDITSRNTH